jgi:hypothetical protein
MWHRDIQAFSQFHDRTDHCFQLQGAPGFQSLEHGSLVLTNFLILLRNVPKLLS